MIEGGQCRNIDPEALLSPVPGISLVSLTVNCTEEGRIGEVDFVGIDANDGTVFLVELLDLEHVLPATETVIVEFIPTVVNLAQDRTQSLRNSPEREGCDLWAWDVGQRMEPETLNVDAGVVSEEQAPEQTERASWESVEKLHVCGRSRTG